MIQQNNGNEDRPLMMGASSHSYQASSSTRSKSSSRRHRQQTNKIKTWLVAVISTLVVFLVIKVVIYVIKVESARTNGNNSQEDRVSQKAKEYSKTAQENLNNLFNSYNRPSKNIPGGCRGTVLILPHCESTLVAELGNDVISVDSCSRIGLERAYYLITQFGKNKRWPVPVENIVLGDKYKRTRAIQTLTPLQVYHEVRDRNHPELYNDRDRLVEHIGELFTNGEMCDQVIVVVPALVKEIPSLAQDLGCGPLGCGNGCPMTFEKGDSEHAWELIYIYDDKNGTHSGTPDPENRIKTAIVSTAGSKDRLENNGSGDNAMQWRVYGNVVEERFDPLAFSKKVGEFDNSTDSSNLQYPRWMNMSIYDDL